MAPGRCVRAGAIAISTAVLTARPEATVAGALGIRLGGPNDYFGQRVEKPWIGDAVRDIAVDDISRTIRLMWVASSLALALFIGVRYWLVGAA